MLIVNPLICCVISLIANQLHDLFGLSLIVTKHQKFANPQKMEKKFKIRRHERLTLFINSEQQ
jgi:hypothetical protein